MDILSKEKILYESVKHKVWVVSFEGYDNGEGYVDNMTAFAVGNGLLMTCAHGEWTTWSDVTITCRPLGTSELTHEARVSYMKLNLDMCLLEVREVGLCDYCHFGNGNLEVGDEVMMVGNPSERVGMGVSGNVLYNCTENPVLQFDEEEICEHYVSQSLTATPAYLVMGHLCNERTIAQDSRSVEPHTLEFQKNLLVNIPVLLCSGLVGGQGASGSPVFNYGGEIVGMLVLGNGEYEICVHVSAIKSFMEMAAKNTGVDVPRGVEDKFVENVGSEVRVEEQEDATLAVGERGSSAVQEGQDGGKRKKTKTRKN